MDSKLDLMARVIEAGGKLTVKSALNPILWLCAIITPPSLIFMQFMQPIPMWLIVLSISPVCTAIIGFLFLLIYDRDRLQSEDFQIKKRKLELMERKGDKEPTIINPNEIGIIRSKKAQKILSQIYGGSK